MLCWIGPIWVIFFPEIDRSFDCYIFYSSFISHNLLSVFTTFIICKYRLKMNFLRDIKYFLFAVSIVLITYLINYDFGTNFNKPNWYILMKLEKPLKYLVLFSLGFIGYAISFVINKIYMGGKNEKV